MAKMKKSTYLQVRLTPALAKAAREKADKAERPLSDVVRDLLKSWLADTPKQASA